MQVKTAVMRGKWPKWLPFMLIFLLAAVLRLWAFGTVPGGLNQDEASIGYDAWSILYYGIDRNGIRLPVHLIAWGSGQNALYAYLSMPFIALMGLTVTSVRMVNLLFGIASVVLVFLILRRLSGTRCAYIGMALAAIAPWCVMVSRWGLESNLFPGLFLLAFYVLLVGFDRHGLLPLAAGLLAICLYAYGAAYLVVPLFCIAAAVYMLVRRKIPLRWLLASVGVFVIVALPIALFVLTNLFHWGDIRIFGFTAPEMTGVTRMATATQSHNLLDSLSYFFRNVILQEDGMVGNQVPGYGTLYLISLPFTAYGVYAAVRRCRREKTSAWILVLVWLGAGLLLFLVYAWTNINRVNILYPAMLLFTALGLDRLCGSTRKLAAVSVCYAVLLCGFCTQYFGPHNEKTSAAFFASFGEAIQAAEALAGEEDTVYVTSGVNAPYIYALFYTRTPPRDYLDTVQIPKRDVEFQWVSTFGHFVFDTSPLSRQAPGIYVLPNSQMEADPSLPEPAARFARYSVVCIPAEN
ncbi:MAG: glycosyltransferase family 39 protein [Clostridiales bacterium]|nr:glycosyltransferase family 39 protein [Clostridiales bacterium]